MGIDMRNGSKSSNEFDCRLPLRSLKVASFSVCEEVWHAPVAVSPQPHAWAGLCLNIAGGYRVDWARTRLDCGPASLLFHAPGEVYGARISDAGSHCLTLAIDPAALLGATDRMPDFERLNAARRAPPHWLAFHLRRELELRDDLSATSVAGIVIELLAELGDRPGLEARRTPPPWLKRVQEQIDDEFREQHTLRSLAEAAGVHHVHLAREFHRRFGCTVGHFIRQRRAEFACHRLTASKDSLSVIAFDAGFADQSHFTNTFRKLVGMSPGLFRARFAGLPLRLPAQG
jgi:AraC family transcriptional regulator